MDAPLAFAERLNKQMLGYLGVQGLLFLGFGAWGFNLGLGKRV